MSRIALGLLCVGALSFGFVGCSDSTTTTEEKKVKTPEGDVKVTNEKTVEKSGDNPPAAP